MSSLPDERSTEAHRQTSAGFPSDTRPADKMHVEPASRSGAHDDTVRGGASDGSPLPVAPFAFDLVVAVLCAALLCCALAAHSPAAAARGPGASGLDRPIAHRTPHLDPGERRSLDNASSEDEGDDRD